MNLDINYVDLKSMFCYKNYKTELLLSNYLQKKSYQSTSFNFTQNPLSSQSFLIFHF